MADLRKQIRATDEQIEKWLRGLKQIFRKSVVETLRNIQGDVAQREALSQLVSLYDVLERTGLSDKLAELTPIYVAELKTIADIYQDIAKANPFSQTDREVIEALITFDAGRVGNTVRDYIGEVQTVLARSVILGTEPDLTLFDDLEDGLGNHLRTELRTLTNSFARTVNAAKAEELGFTLFQYVGPDDDVTRPFCESLLSESPPIYSIEQINEMTARNANGQGLDVMQYGGGYNCRHRWEPISLEDARAEGYRG